MRKLVLIVGGGLLFGCGSSDVAALVAQQEESEERQTELEETMGDLKKQMQEVGLVARPARNKCHLLFRVVLNIHLHYSLPPHLHMSIFDCLSFAISVM